MELDDFEELNILLTVWIIACNDENHLITYKGLVKRLGIDNEPLIKNIVHRHRELFRITGGKRLLEEWKSEMLRNEKTPSWIKSIDDPDEKRNVIESLTTDDIFRSQFRCEDIKRSSIELMDWGIKHIDRLRQIKANVDENRYKWITSYGIPVITSLVGLMSLFASVYIQSRTVSNQSISQATQIYQAELKPKSERYAAVMAGLKNEHIAATSGDSMRVDTIQNRLQLDFLNLDPFLSYQSEKSSGVLIKTQLNELNKLCKLIAAKSISKKPYTPEQTAFLKLNGDFQNNLRNALFPKIEIH